MAYLISIKMLVRKQRKEEINFCNPGLKRLLWSSLVSESRGSIPLNFTVETFLDTYNL